MSSPLKRFMITAPEGGEKALLKIWLGLQHCIVHEQCIGNAQQDAGDYLNRRMAHKFLQFCLGKFFVGQNVNGFQQFVDDLSLLAGFPTDAHSVMADDDGENCAYSKLERVRTAGKSGIDRQRRNCGRMTAGHTAVAEQTLQVPCFKDNGVDNYF